MNLDNKSNTQQQNLMKNPKIQKRIPDIFSKNTDISNNHDTRTRSHA